MSEKEFQLGPEDLYEIEKVVPKEIPKTPLDIDFHRKTLEGNEVAEERFEKMILLCLNYVEDFAKHKESQYSGDDEKKQNQLDRKRTAAHNEMIESVDAYFEILEDIKRKNPLSPVDTDWKHWPKYSPQNADKTRVIYGKFAITLTLNRFKDQILKFIEYREKLSSGFDFEKLRKIHEGERPKILIINYIEILCSILKEDREANEQEVATLQLIKEELSMDENAILASFHQMYFEDYKKNN